MKHIFGKNRQSGFSLVELMIVVGIIGVLATLALPRFKQFQAKAKMAEAMNVLQHVYTLEQSYSLDNNTFVAVDPYGANTGTATGSNTTCQAAGKAPTVKGTAELGFVIEPCVATAPTPRFQYNVLSPDAATFTAQATTGAAASNRVCNGNAAFVIKLDQSNAPSYKGTAGDKSGTAIINETCPL